jgi:glycosyltransferase involved in cell wall biosynthesis
LNFKEIFLEDAKMQNHSPILVVIAALNEEEGIGPTLKELQDVLRDPYLIVVDGKSVDRTIEIAKSMGANVLSQEGKGKGAALFQGFKRLNSDMEYVVFTDADFTYPAEYVPAMLDVLEQNPDVGMVTGNRFNSHFKLSAMKNSFYVGNRVLATAQLLLNGMSLKDPLTGLRALRWSILKNWEPKSSGFDIEVEMNHRVENMGYEIVEIPIQYRCRLGAKKLKLRDGIMILRRIISESLK